LRRQIEPRSKKVLRFQFKEGATTLTGSCALTFFLPFFLPFFRDPNWPFFPTLMHTFAQTIPPISIDAQKHFLYLPSQIEPGSLKLYGSV
jgi:hypothetical protein